MLLQEMETYVINVSSEIVSSFIDAGHEAARRGLMKCSSGNLSLRVDEARMLISASRSWLDRIGPDELSVCRIADGELIEGGRPSVETAFHAGILRIRPEVNVVLHFQSPCAAALVCMDQDTINYFVIPEIPYYLGPIGQVGYLKPGSRELAEAVVETVKGHDMAVLQNHGLVTVGRDFDQVIQNAEFFELACSIILHGKNSVHPLAQEHVDEMLTLREEAKRGV